MGTTKQPSGSTQVPSVPDGIIHAIENLYDEQNQLRFIEECELRPLVDTSFHKGHTTAREAKDQLAGLRLEMAIDASFPTLYPFDNAAIKDMAFQSDLIVGIYDVLASGENCYDRLRTNSFLRFASSWAKLQFVLAAEHYESEPDTMGLVVGNAWKDGNGQGIMTANFDFARCSDWLAKSSQRGLNAIHPAPKKRIGKMLYRGGALSSELSHGMSWTDDHDEAVFFAKRQHNGPPVVVSTQTKRNCVLVRFEHEREVVLPYDPMRPFEVEFI